MTADVADRPYGFYSTKPMQVELPTAAPARAPRVDRLAETKAMHDAYCGGMSVPAIAEKWGLEPHTVYSRFSRAGLRRTDRGLRITAGMYFDYCTGLTTQQVADKWGVPRSTVNHRFKHANLPMRPRTGGTVTPKSPKGTPFELANDQRAAEAGRRRAREAAAALPLVANPTYRQVLELRMSNPAATLAELAELCDPPMTKDAYAANLRRALSAVPRAAS